MERPDFFWHERCQNGQYRQHGRPVTYSHCWRAECGAELVCAYSLGPDGLVLLSDLGAKRFRCLGLFWDCHYLHDYRARRWHLLHFHCHRHVD